ncbi:MAG: hypothetical protein K8J31_02465 [Anaerolineae bacterium]|nr:hypothetical protein [Anaerolineae bacterium]
MDELICPHCGKRMRYDSEQEKIMCHDCQYSPLDARMAAIQAQGPRQRVQLSYRGEINRNALAAFHTGHDWLHRDNPVQALESFKRAVYFQRDFADAHIAIADLVEDEATKRDHLGTVIAFDPTNPEALRRLMVLNGRLTEEEVTHTYHYRDQQVKQIDSVEATRSEILLCPVCGGQLTVDEATGQVECRYCGHVEVRAPSRDVGEDLLSMALIERKARPVRWVVGQRILHCNSCGAERTIPARQLTHECPVCGSQHVIQQEAIESLEQPDGLVPFQISRHEAGTRIKAELQNLRHRLVALFDDNRVAQGTLEPVYLPFWLFDALADVTETRTYTGSDRDVLGFVGRGVQSSTTFTDGMYNVPVCGVTSPSAELTARLMPYDLEEMVAYQSKLLAKYPAQLYNLDFDQASLEARGTISKTLREKHGRREIGDEQVKITVSSLVKSVSFRLVLMPVWIAHLIEVDDDTRLALVNGQNGRVILGKSQKRPR